MVQYKMIDRVWVATDYGGTFKMLIQIQQYLNKAKKILTSKMMPGHKGPLLRVKVRNRSGYDAN
ncbi:MAG: hypothetical protein QNK31_10900 [Porticoccus sp.]|nr:hypothetical protein [Porticoccus sp.]